MNNGIATVILLIVISVIVLIVLFGMPNAIKVSSPIIEASWDLNEPTTNKTVPAEPEIKDIIIENIASRQEIYEPGEIAYVDFEITNRLNSSYDISVDWLYNNSRYHGWMNTSIAYVNTTEQKNVWYSYYTVKQTGDWKVHLVIKYILENQTISKDKTAEFKVI